MPIERLSLRPEVDEVRRLNRWLDRAMDDAGVAARVGEALKLCLNEAIGNVILYAFDDDGTNAAIELECSLDACSAWAVVADNGRPFNPLERPSRDRHADLATTEIGGFGIQLIRENASEVDYRRVDGWNRLRIVCAAA